MMMEEEGVVENSERYRLCVNALKGFMDDAGFSDVVIGLSGGMDSSLVAVMCADALGADRGHAAQGMRGAAGRGSEAREAQGTRDARVVARRARGAHPAGTKGGGARSAGSEGARRARDEGVRGRRMGARSAGCEGFGSGAGASRKG